MSHAISNINGFNEMAYVGEMPWHGLGQGLTPGADLDTWLTQAGMAWRVQRSKVRYFTDPEGTQQREWEDRHVLFRSDNKAPLGLVSDRYQVVQPKQVLEFFYHVAEENRLALETAGTLNGGRQYWALARTAMGAAIGGVDPINAYVLLATSADGSMATQAQFTSVRVVCANTLAMARANSANAIRVKHSTKFDATQVRMDLGLAEETFEAFTQTAARLASRPLSRADALKVLIQAVGDEVEFKKAFEENHSVQRALEEQPNARVMAQILDLFNGKAYGSSLATANGTAWGLVNAATQYFDHDAGRTADSRINSAWFGVNAGRKQDVVDAALALCD